MTKHIQSQLNESMINIRWGLIDTPVNPNIPSKVNVLPAKNQLNGIHTILRDHRTPRDEFIFYADRLAVNLME